MLKYLLVLTILISCSRVNQESQDYYQKKNHGLRVTKTSTPYQPDSSLEAKGKKLFDTSCKKCHGAGATKRIDTLEHKGYSLANFMKKLGHTKKVEFYLGTSQGVGNMPGWEKQFSEDDIKALSAYLNSLK